jgi:AAA15 family ATPase/GTPase
LFLSTAAQWNHEQLLKIFKWFSELFVVLPNRESGIALTNKMFLDTQSTQEKSKLHDLAINILKDADFGIDDVRIEKIVNDELRFADDIPEITRKSILRNTNLRPLYKTTFSHCNGKYSLPLEEESDGTQKFYSFLGALLQSISFGYSVFEDELELNMHPLLTRRIIELVRDFEGQNKQQAQLIFTTHDTTLLDPELFGRDQVWFTEKNNDGATELYSLAEYKEKARKNEPMQKRYLAGRYGAIPILESFTANE